MARERDGAADRGRSVFLEVGGDILVRWSDVVAILDEPALEAAPTREFIGFARRRGRVEDLCGGNPARSAVVCRRKVLLTPLAGATLRRRALSSRVM